MGKFVTYITKKDYLVGVKQIISSYLLIMDWKMLEHY